MDAFFYLDLNTTDPAFNLAVEQRLFDRLEHGTSCLMLWRNDNAVVIGRYQNARSEVDPQALEAFGSVLVRRKSGGGAVYHDLGNLNYTYITDAPLPDRLDLRTYCLPVLEVLRDLGVNAELNGRNDMVVNGLKISGSAAYVEGGRLVHHGTLLYDSDLDRIPRLLSPERSKLQQKDIPSVRSRITNIRAHLPADIPPERFRSLLLERLTAGKGAVPLALGEEDRREIEAIRRSRYGNPAWNWGAPPACVRRFGRRYEGVGLVEACLDIEDGLIRGLAFQGDFFSLRDPAELARRFLGKRADAAGYREAVDGVDLSQYFSGISAEQFLALFS